MEFVSKYNLTFIKYVDAKYNKRFKSFEDYAQFIFDINNCIDKNYYDYLEQDLREYCSYQQERKNSYGKSKN